MGITLEQSMQNHPFNGRILFGFLLLGMNIFHQYMFIFNEAQGFREHIESIYMASIGTVGFLCFATVVFKMDHLFKLIKKSEEVIVKSESKLLIFNYNLDKKIRTSAVLYLVLNAYEIT